MIPRLSALVLTLALFASCASEGKPSGKREGVIEARSRVVAIDASQRKLTLKDEDGTQYVVGLSQDVRNVDQIHVGDEVAVSYTETISWQVKSAGQGAPGASSEASATRAKAGEKPGGQVNASVTMTATISEIDIERGTVTITGPRGNRLVLRPRDPANLKKVKVGDLIDIGYSAALAIAVRPVEK
jgi:Cu/Ag efflux protein CusF